MKCIYNNKSKTQKWILRTSEILLGFGILLFVVAGISLMPSIGFLFGMIIIAITIPIIILVFITEYLYRNRAIIKVKLYSDKFRLFYINKNKYIIVPYNSIISRNKFHKGGQDSIRYTTDLNFKAYIFCKKGEIVSFIFDNEIFSKIDTGYKIWKKSNKSN